MFRALVQRVFLTHEMTLDARDSDVVNGQAIFDLIFYAAV